MHTTRALARELGVLDLVDARAYDRVVTLDGTKVVLDTGWWFGVRASGTEPVVRPYVETFAAPGAPAIWEAFRPGTEPTTASALGFSGDGQPLLPGTPAGNTTGSGGLY